MTIEEQMEIAGGEPVDPPDGESSNSSDEDKASVAMDRIIRARDWRRDNFDDIWLRASKSYYSIRDPIQLTNQTQAPLIQGRPVYASDTIPTLRAASTRVKAQDQQDGLPHVWNATQRLLARINANVPEMSIRTQDEDLSTRLGYTYMRAWDHSQRKSRVIDKSIIQTFCTGWTVTRFGWQDNMAKRRVLVSPERATDDQIQAILAQWEPQIKKIQNDMLMQSGRDPGSMSEDDYDEMTSEAINILAEQVGHNGRIPLMYNARGYVGPSAHFVFCGDMYPQPDFDTLNTSDYCAEYRRIDVGFLHALIVEFGRFDKSLAGRIKKLLADHPNGSPRTLGGPNEQLRSDFYNVLNRVMGKNTTRDGSLEAKWNAYIITYPGKDGEDAMMEIVVEDTYWLGCWRIPYLMDNGNIPYSELRVVESILGGPGDTPIHRILPLVDLSSQIFLQRFDLLDALSRPLMWTRDRELYENPDKFIRHTSGIRVVFAKNGNQDMGFEQSGPAIASALATLQEDESIMRVLNSTLGDNNMTQMAEIDPKQNATATGAKIMQANLDLMTRQYVNMFRHYLQDSMEVMRQLFRSELTEDLYFDAANYAIQSGKYSGKQDLMITVSPEDFQDDGDITIDLDSIFPEAQEMKINKANQLYQLAKENQPGMNMRYAIENMLRALGQGRYLDKWINPTPPPAAVNPDASANQPSPQGDSPEPQPPQPQPQGEQPNGPQPEPTPAIPSGIPQAGPA